MPLKTRLRKVLRTKPRRFQAKGIWFLEKTNGRALLGDDMGLGKTIQVLGWLALHPEARPVVIACPANAKYEWERQIQQHTRQMRCQVLSGKTPQEVYEDIIIVNYDILSYWEETLTELRPKVLALDECHYVKNRQAKRTQSCKKLAKAVPHIIAMSGTPILNRPSEFFPVLNMLYPKEFSSFWKYAFRYCNPKRGFKGRGWTFDGATNTEELHKRVSSFMLRRMKTEVLTELPPKQRVPILVDLDNMNDYLHARDDFLTWYEKEVGKDRAKKAEGAVGFVRIGQLKKLAAVGKAKTGIQWIEEFLSSTDQKLVVFCHHRIIFNLLTKHFAKVSAIGGKGGRERKIQVAKFQKDNRIRLFIGSLKADREAITLTAASTVLFLEMAWTPAVHDQAEDRVNRIGQEAEAITAYYLLARNSIDEHIWALIEQKRQVLARVLDGETVKQSMRRSITLTELVQQMNRKER